MLIKKAQVQQDRSLKTITLSLLERGEIIGLEECEQKQNPPPRKHTVVCKSHGSILLFISYENWVSRVLNHVDLQKDIQFDNLQKELLYKLRLGERDRTLWRNRNLLRQQHSDPEEVQMQSTAEFVQQQIQVDYQNMAIK